MTSRETVMTALLATLSGIGEFALASRRNYAPEQIGPALSPALFVLEDAEDYERKSVAMPATRHLMISVMLYNDVGADLNAIPSTVINNALDALDLALQPNSPANIYTLGGLVDSVVIEGEIKKAPGDRTGKAVAIVPLRIVLP